MNRILTKYNITNLSADNPLSVTYALNERCKMIPESVSLAYFVKVLCTQDPIKANKLHSQSFLLTLEKTVKVTPKKRRKMTPKS